MALKGESQTGIVIRIFKAVLTEEKLHVLVTRMLYLRFGEIQSDLF